MTADLAEKVVARGLDLNGGELAWEAYHLAKENVELREALGKITRCQSFAKAKWLARRALSQQEAGGAS